MPYLAINDWTVDSLSFMVAEGGDTFMQTTMEVAVQLCHGDNAPETFSLEGVLPTVRRSNSASFKPSFYLMYSIGIQWRIIGQSQHEKGCHDLGPLGMD